MSLPILKRQARRPRSLREERSGSIEKSWGAKSIITAERSDSAQILFGLFGGRAQSTGCKGPANITDSILHGFAVRGMAFEKCNSRRGRFRIAQTPSGGGAYEIIIESDIYHIPNQLPRMAPTLRNMITTASASLIAGTSQTKSNDWRL
jgi:hypothetical protein